MRIYTYAFAAACLFGVAGCQKGVDEDTMVANAKVQVKKVGDSKAFDADSQKFVEDCMNSDSFRVQARMAPVINQALESGAMSEADATAKYQHMLDKHPENADYWNVCLKNVSRHAAVKKGEK